MPIYEYECQSCQQVHEMSQKMSAPPLNACPSCRGSVRKLMSRSAIAFKGTGFYTTDYKRAGEKTTTPTPPSCAANGGSCSKPECVN